jgi:uncharacterized protein
MHAILTEAGHALVMAAGMAWQTLWSLVLGFALSGLLQATVPAERMRNALGRGGPREVALAAAAGAASSSCSYASAAITRTLFKKGAALTSSVAFLLASTNLVLELGVVIWLLLGWRFTLAEWLGGMMLVALVATLIRVTAGRALVERARNHPEPAGGHEHMSMASDRGTWRERLLDPETRVRTAQNFAMDWRMLWKDLAAGFLIGGVLAVAVPDRAWAALFLQHAEPWVRTLAGVVIGPVVAILSFVCSIGNVPLAAALWGGGASFGGMLAFLYSDLLIIPLLDVYRRYFGWRMMAYLAALLFVGAAASALVVDLGFTAAGLVPPATHGVPAEVTRFSFNYTFWLNLVALAVATWLFAVARRHPMDHGHHGHNHDGHGHHCH